MAPENKRLICPCGGLIIIIDSSLNMSVFICARRVKVEIIFIKNTTFKVACWTANLAMQSFVVMHQSPPV